MKLVSCAFTGQPTEVLRLPVDPFKGVPTVELTGPDVKAIQRLHRRIEKESTNSPPSTATTKTRRGGRTPFRRHEQRDTLVVLLAAPSESPSTGYDPLLAALGYLGFSATCISLSYDAWGFANWSASSNLDPESQKLHESLREARDSAAWLDREPDGSSVHAVSHAHKEKVLRALYPLLNELESQILEVCARYPSTSLALVGGTDASWVLHAFLESRGNQWRWLRPGWSLVSLDDTPTSYRSGMAQDIATAFPERSPWVRYLHIHSTVVQSDADDDGPTLGRVANESAEVGVQTCLVSTDKESAAEVEECFVHHLHTDPSQEQSPKSSAPSSTDLTPSAGEHPSVHLDGGTAAPNPTSDLKVSVLMRPALMEHWITKLDARLAAKSTHMPTVSYYGGNSETKNSDEDEEEKGEQLE